MAERRKEEKPSEAELRMEGLPLLLPPVDAYDLFALDSPTHLGSHSVIADGVRRARQQPGAE